MKADSEKRACLLLRFQDRARAETHLNGQGFAVTDRLDEGTGFLLAEEELLLGVGKGLADRCRQMGVPLFLLAEREDRFGRQDEAARRDALTAAAFVLSFLGGSSPSSALFPPPAPAPFSSDCRGRFVPALAGRSSLAAPCSRSPGPPPAFCRPLVAALKVWARPGGGRCWEARVRTKPTASRFPDRSPARSTARGQGSPPSPTGLPTQDNLEYAKARSARDYRMAPQKVSLANTRVFSASARRHAPRSP